MLYIYICILTIKVKDSICEILSDIVIGKDFITIKAKEKNPYGKGGYM